MLQGSGCGWSVTSGGFICAVIKLIYNGGLFIFDWWLETCCLYWLSCHSLSLRAMPPNAFFSTCLRWLRGHGHALCVSACERVSVACVTVCRSPVSDTRGHTLYFCCVTLHCPPGYILLPHLYGCFLQTAQYTHLPICLFVCLSVYLSNATKMFD